MSYTPPALDNANFELQSYTPPALDNVDFELGTAISGDIKESSAFLRATAAAQTGNIVRVKPSSSFSEGIGQTQAKGDRIKGAIISVSGTGNTQSTAEAEMNASSFAHGTGKQTWRALVLSVPTGAYVIDSDNYRTKNQPSKSDEMANKIIVQTQPLRPTNTAEQVYDKKITLVAGETKTLTVSFDEEPVIEANGYIVSYNIEETFTSNYDTAVSLAKSNLVENEETVTTLDGETEFVEGSDYNMDYTNGDITVLSSGSMSDNTDYLINYEYADNSNISITNTNYYAWGADITIENNDSIENIIGFVVDARPLEVRGVQKITAEDAESIREHEEINYELEENQLIQTEQMAQDIASKVLDSAVDPRRDVELDWRGNPALILADLISVPEFQGFGNFYVIRQNIEYDGALTANTEGRKL